MSCFSRSWDVASGLGEIDDEGDTVTSGEGGIARVFTSLRNTA